jgi:hypothetical protein
MEKFGKNEACFDTKGNKDRWYLFVLDLGFAAYVSYLHMEVTHTNPIMLGK